MQVLYFIVVAVLAVIIYRQGIKDGQAVSKGEQIKSIVKTPFKPSESAEQKRIAEGLKNIISYGLGDKK